VDVQGYHEGGGVPARQPVRRKPRRQARPLRPQPPLQRRDEAAAPEAAPAPAAVAPGPRPSALSPTRMALQARAAELARLDVLYLRHDLRNIGIIAGLMLAVVIALSFILH